MAESFDDYQKSMHVYNGIKAISANSPEELASIINRIKVPIKVWQWVADKGKYTAFISGNFKIRRVANGN